MTQKNKHHQNNLAVEQSVVKATMGVGVGGGGGVGVEFQLEPNNHPKMIVRLVCKLPNSVREHHRKKQCANLIKSVWK